MAWAPDYVSVEQFAAYMRVADDGDAAVHAWAITAASRAIDQACNRQFGLVSAPEARYYPAERWAGRWVVNVDDLMTSVGLSVTGVDSPTPGPRNAPSIGRPWTRLVLPTMPADLDEVEVTAQWGWTAIPAAVEQACLLQASRFVMRRDSPFGVAGSPETGSELRLLARIDPDVEVTLRAYRRLWGAV